VFPDVSQLSAAIQDLNIFSPSDAASYIEANQADQSTEKGTGSSSEGDIMHVRAAIDPIDAVTVQRKLGMKAYFQGNIALRPEIISLNEDLLSQATKLYKCFVCKTYMNSQALQVCTTDLSSLEMLLEKKYWQLQLLYFKTLHVQRLGGGGSESIIALEGTFNKELCT
jgi:hypothetical protein